MISIFKTYLKKKFIWQVVLLSSVFLFSGCTLLILGGAAYYFADGKMITNYEAPFNQTWNACEKTITDMQGIEVDSIKANEQGKITTLIQKEKVKFEITRKSENLTTVSILVGFMGNKNFSQMLLDQISNNLVKKL